MKRNILKFKISQLYRQFKPNLIPTIFIYSWLLVFIFLYLMVLFTSEQITIWPPSFNATGLRLFVEIFSIPLYFLVTGIPILGIFLTIKRINQTNKQYIALVRSNYQQHFRDFSETILSTCSADMDYIFKVVADKNKFLIDLHSLCFGNRESFDYLPNEEVYQLLDELYEITFDISQNTYSIYDIQSYLEYFGFDADLDFHTNDETEEIEYMTSALYIIERMAQFIGYGEELSFNKSFEKEIKTN